MDRKQLRVFAKRAGIDDLNEARRVYKAMLDRCKTPEIRAQMKKISKQSDVVFNRAKALAERKAKALEEKRFKEEGLGNCWMAAIEH